MQMTLYRLWAVTINQEKLSGSGSEAAASKVCCIYHLHLYELVYSHKSVGMRVERLKVSTQRPEVGNEYLM